MTQDAERRIRNYILEGLAYRPWFTEKSRHISAVLDISPKRVGNLLAIIARTPDRGTSVGTIGRSKGRTWLFRRDPPDPSDPGPEPLPYPWRAEPPWRSVERPR